MIHLKTVRKELELKLEVYSVDELIKECKYILKELRLYQEENEWQIKYYEKFWLLLSEY